MNISNNFDDYSIKPRIAFKSQLGLEFRRFSVVRPAEQVSANDENSWTFTSFHNLIEQVHELSKGTLFSIFYKDEDGEILPITNDMNFACMLRKSFNLFRLFVKLKDDPDCWRNAPQPLIFKNKRKFSQAINPKRRAVQASDQNTTHSPSSASNAFIIDTDIIPNQYRRVRLYKQKENKPLGFYVRDGIVYKSQFPGGVIEQVSGIFVSKLLPGGLAECAGLLSINDEIVEVNGISVKGKSLDQVTDMMIANSHNLVLTVKPSDQRFNLPASLDKRSDSASISHSMRSSSVQRSSSSDEDFIA
ncbi:hypothetical protein GJ496_009332 [Pomphorhynchus laevis]|nr:hypothetical protein GJ496_009332 [Pomphorhynchus laevis]